MARTLILICFAAFLTSGCNFLSRLARVGEKPVLAKIENPVEKPGYEPVEMPRPTPELAVSNPNSLWRSGSRSFFKDQRASQIGDILTVLVSVKDSAQMQNQTQQRRGDDSDSLGIGALGGLENTLGKVLPGGFDPTSLINVTSAKRNNGLGSINRTESLDLKLAATVTQILPNGNMVIYGSQEIRVNSELRQLEITGIVRKSDLFSNNTVTSEKIAELRFSYGGKGTISDMQQPRYGRELIDIISPF